MIVRVKYGDSMSGLAKYLTGPGIGNEHENQHVIDGSPSVMLEYGERELDHLETLQLAAQLDQSKRLAGAKIAGGTVHHMSLSTPAEDGMQTDEEWSRIVREQLRGMGLIDVPGKADVPWAAVRHGTSKGGNDHVHVAVSLVREDGSKVSTWQSKTAAQRVARQVERDLDLPTKLAEGYGARSFPTSEIEAGLKQGRPEAVRATLSRQVRAASVAADREVEFIHYLRRQGVLVKPTFDEGETTVVGASYALPAVTLEDGTVKGPYHFAGHDLGNDLGLNVLRESWEADESAHPETVREWWSAKFDGPWDRDAHDVRPASDEEFDRAVKGVRGFVKHAGKLAADDVHGQRRVAATAAGLLAALSNRVEGWRTPGEFARASDEVAQAAQMSRSGYRKPESKWFTPSEVVAAIHRLGDVSRERAQALVQGITYLVERVRQFASRRDDSGRTVATVGSAVERVESKWDLEAQERLDEKERRDRVRAEGVRTARHAPQVPLSRPYSPSAGQRRGPRL